jgi:hypothetical protein
MCNAGIKRNVFRYPHKKESFADVLIFNFIKIKIKLKLGFLHLNPDIRIPDPATLMKWGPHGAGPAATLYT